MNKTEIISILEKIVLPTQIRNINIFGSEVIIDLNIAFGGMASIPKFAFKTQKFLIGKKFNKNNIYKSKDFIEKDFNPLSDMRASEKYRKFVSKNLLEKFLLEIKNNQKNLIE